MCLIQNRFKSVSTWCLKGTLCEGNNEAGLAGGNEAQTPGIDRLPSLNHP